MSSYKLKEKNFISIVVYLRNNENIIESFLNKVDSFLNEHFENYEFILVDDASSDKTIEKIKHSSPNIRGNISVLNLSWNHGLDISMRAGVDLSIGDFIFEFDTSIIDYDMQLIMDLYNKCLNGNDIVSASPKNATSYTSKKFYQLLAKVSHKKMILMTETVRILSRRAVNRIDLSNVKIVYRKALYQYSGLNITTIIYNPTKTLNHSDSLSFTEKIKLASDVLISYSNIGTKLAMYLSAIFFIIGLAVILYTITTYFALGSEQIQAGWTTLMLFISVSFSGLFSVLAVISKYLSSILREVQDKPLYTFKQVERL